jgi:hypothetical protein
MVLSGGARYGLDANVPGMWPRTRPLILLNWMDPEKLSLHAPTVQSASFVLA